MRTAPDRSGLFVGQVHLADKGVVDFNFLPAVLVLVVAALMHYDLLDKLPQQGGGQLLKADVPADDVHKTLRIDRRFLRLGKLRLQLGGVFPDLPLLGFIVGGKLGEAFVGNASGYAVLIQPLEDGGQLPDALLGCVQFLFPGCVSALAAVLVLLNQQLHELLFVFGGVGGDFFEVGGHACGQKVGADKVRRAVMGALLVVAADIAVLFPGLVLIPLLVKDAAAVGAEQQTGEQAHFIIAVWTLALLTQLLHTLPCIGVDDRLVGVLENHLLFLRVLHAAFDLVGHLLRLEVDQMPQILNLTVEFVFFVYLIPFSFIYLKNTIESGQVSPACGIPMYYVQAAPFVCFIITAFRIAQRWFGEWKIVLGKENKLLEEGSIASVIEEAVVEDTYREKELVEDIEAIHSKAEKRKEK